MRRSSRARPCLRVKETKHENKISDGAKERKTPSFMRTVEHLACGEGAMREREVAGVYPAPVVEGAADELPAARG